MKKMSLTHSQSPPPAKSGQGQGVEMTCGEEISPPTSPIDVMVGNEFGHGSERDSGGGEMLSTSLPSPLPAHQQFQYQQKQQQQQKQFRSGARGETVQPTQSAFLGQRNSNKLSSSRVRRADGRTKSNLVNEAKPIRSHQRDMQQKRNFIKENAAKSSTVAAAATTSLHTRTSKSQGGVPGKGRRRTESSRFLEAQHVSTQKTKGGYSARHHVQKKTSPPGLRQVSQASNPSIAMNVRDLQSAENNYNSTSGKAAPPDFDSLDTAMQSQVKPAPPRGGNIFICNSEPSSRASTPVR